MKQSQQFHTRIYVSKMNLKSGKKRLHFNKRSTSIEFLIPAGEKEFSRG